MQTNSLKSLFLLDPSVIFLNFGSFGACPKPIFDDYQKWQLELEKEPVQFITANGLRYLQTSREALGGYVNAHPDDLVYFPNPSHAVNAVAKNLALQPGDEVLSTNLEYGACDRTWRFYCAQAGARYVRQDITLPLLSKEQFVDDFFKGLSAKTKLVFISHITSTTGLILPVKEICARARELGIMSMVDGAHAPGQIPLDLQDVGADFYTGACHKWMMTAKGSSFLYAQKAVQHFLNPLVVSWGYESVSPSHSQFIDYHQGQGTRDFSAFLTITKAIAFMKEHNWDLVSQQCRLLVKENAARFFDLLQSQALAPLHDEFIGQMLSIPIKTTEPEKLQVHLFQKYNIEIPVMRHDDWVFIRYSINGFNSQSDLDALYNALTEMKEQGLYI